MDYRLNTSINTNHRCFTESNPRILYYENYYNKSPLKIVPNKIKNIRRTLNNTSLKEELNLYDQIEPNHSYCSYTQPDYMNTSNNTFYKTNYTPIDNSSSINEINTISKARLVRRNKDNQNNSSNNTSYLLNQSNNSIKNINTNNRNYDYSDLLVNPTAQLPVLNRINKHFEPREKIHNPYNSVNNHIDDYYNNNEINNRGNRYFENYNTNDIWDSSNRSNFSIRNKIDNKNEHLRNTSTSRSQSPYIKEIYDKIALKINSIRQRGNRNFNEYYSSRPITSTANTNYNRNNIDKAHNLVNSIYPSNQYEDRNSNYNNEYKEANLNYEYSTTTNLKPSRTNYSNKQDIQSNNSIKSSNIISFRDTNNISNCTNQHTYLPPNKTKALTPNFKVRIVEPDRNNNENTHNIINANSYSSRNKPDEFYNKKSKNLSINDNTNTLGIISLRESDCFTSNNVSPEVKRLVPNKSSFNINSRKESLDVQIQGLESNNDVNKNMSSKELKDRKHKIKSNHKHNESNDDSSYNTDFLTKLSKPSNAENTNKLINQTDYINMKHDDNDNRNILNLKKGKIHKSNISTSNRNKRNIDNDEESNQDIKYINTVGSSESRNEAVNYYLLNEKYKESKNKIKHLEESFNKLQTKTSKISSQNCYLINLNKKLQGLKDKDALEKNKIDNDGFEEYVDIKQTNNNAISSSNRNVKENYKNNLPNIRKNKLERVNESNENNDLNNYNTNANTNTDVNNTDLNRNSSKEIFHIINDNNKYNQENLEETSNYNQTYNNTNYDISDSYKEDKKNHINNDNHESNDKGDNDDNDDNDYNDNKDLRHSGKKHIIETTILKNNNKLDFSNNKTHIVTIKRHFKDLNLDVSKNINDQKSNTLNHRETSNYNNKANIRNNNNDNSSTIVSNKSNNSNQSNNSRYKKKYYRFNDLKQKIKEEYDKCDEADKNINSNVTNNKDSCNNTHDYCESNNKKNCDSTCLCKVLNTNNSKIKIIIEKNNTKENKRDNRSQEFRKNSNNDNNESINSNNNGNKSYKIDDEIYNDDLAQNYNDDGMNNNNYIEEDVSNDIHSHLERESKGNTIDQNSAQKSKHNNTQKKSKYVNKEINYTNLIPIDSNEIDYTHNHDDYNSQENSSNCIPISEISNKISTMKASLKNNNNNISKVNNNTNLLATTMDNKLNSRTMLQRGQQPLQNTTTVINNSSNNFSNDKTFPYYNYLMSKEETNDSSHSKKYNLIKDFLNECKSVLNKENYNKILKIIITNSFKKPNISKDSNNEQSFENTVYISNAFQQNCNEKNMKEIDSNIEENKLMMYNQVYFYIKHLPLLIQKLEKVVE